MPTPKDLLHRLFEYIGEQLKQVDPRGFCMTGSKAFVLRPGDLAMLPGVQFDIQVAGDHIWLKIERLVAGKPPAVHEKFRTLIRVSDDPNGPAPSLNEANIARMVSQAGQEKPAGDQKDVEARARAAATHVLNEYAALWNAWAVGERPKRTTIGLYGEFFSIKHALEAEETARPIELVWHWGRYLASVPGPIC